MRLVYSVRQFHVNLVQRDFSEVEYILALRCEAVDFSGSIALQVPLAFDVSFFFKSGEERVDRAWSKVDSEMLAEAGDDLVSMHGLTPQEL